MSESESNKKSLSFNEKAKILLGFHNRVYEIYLYSKYKNISYHDKMKLYGLYKQSMFGNIRKKRPFWCYFMNRYKIDKWEAWNENYNFEKYSAMSLYILHADGILELDTDNIIRCADF